MGFVCFCVGLSGFGANLGFEVELVILSLM